MLTLVPSKSFEVEVAIPMPTGKDAKIKVGFKHKGRKALEEWLKTDDGENAEPKKDFEALAEVIENWKGVDAEYSEENLEVLLDSYPAAGRALISGYLQAMLEGKVKN